MSSSHDVPGALRRWFVVHCIADLLFAIPLFIAPVALLKLAGWSQVDPLATRLACAALFGIGLESWLGRHGGREKFLGMLRLKIIWSLTASIGLGWSTLDGGPVAGWVLFGIFVAFNILWTYWYIRLKKAEH